MTQEFATMALWIKLITFHMTEDPIPVEWDDAIKTDEISFQIVTEDWGPHRTRKRPMRFLPP